MSEEMLLALALNLTTNGETLMFLYFHLAERIKTFYK